MDKLRVHSFCIIFLVSTLGACSNSSKEKVVDSKSDKSLISEQINAPVSSFPTPHSFDENGHAIGAGILNNEVPENYKVEFLQKHAEKSLFPFNGLWKGVSYRAGANFEQGAPRSFEVQIEIINEQIDSIGVTNRFGEVSIGKDVKFSDSVLTFEFFSGLDNAHGEPLKQFAHLLLVDGKLKGILRLKVDDRADFDVSIKDVVKLEKIN